MSLSSEQKFLESSIKLFRYYKGLGEKAIEQLNDEEVLRKPNEAGNSIALIVHHISGNLQSRFTEFLTSDGEKPWRNRDLEFEEAYPDKPAMMSAWEKGWQCLLNALSSLRPEDLTRIIYIRNEGQTVIEAVQRQLAHIPYHIGQILYQAKCIKGNDFKSLTIPKGASDKFNQVKFSQEKSIRHFTDGLKDSSSPKS